MKQQHSLTQTQLANNAESTELKTASAHQLGKDLFGKYASADDSGSTNRRAHSAARLEAKIKSLNNLIN